MMKGWMRPAAAAVVACVGFALGACESSTVAPEDPGSAPEALMSKIGNPGGPFDFAVGEGKNTAGEYFSFSAHDGPRGPSGYARIVFPNFVVQGPVTCYHALGPVTARFAIRIAKSTGTIPPDAHSFVFWVEDRTSHDTPDVMGTGFSELDPMTDCEASDQFGGTPLVEGDILVKHR